MVVEGPETVEDYEKILQTILELQANPYCDQFMFMSLVERRKRIEAKIEELKLQNS